MSMKVTPKVILSKFPSMHSIDCVFSDMSYPNQNERISFPEFGVELVGNFELINGLLQNLIKIVSEPGFNSPSVIDDPNDTEGSSTPIHVLPESWHDNWLFCRKRMNNRQLQNHLFRSSSLFHLFQEDPVAMLVPNPVEELKAKVGARDIDELSDLSERLSVASNDECCFSPSSEEMEHDKAESGKLFPSLDGQERDLEHTEYAVLPLQIETSSDESNDLTLTKNDLTLTKVPNELKVEDGGVIKLECQVHGKRPLGN